MKKVKNMKTSEVIEVAKGHLAEVTNLKVNSVIGLKKGESGWQITVELLEKSSVPDAMDLLGIYEVTLDEQGGLVNFERKGLRKRGDTEITEIGRGI